MEPLSVVICCANAGDTLGQACESVAWADELVIVDSGSADDTATIARRHADRYVLEPWRGYSGQKEFAVSLARNDWVFVLDGDEECSPELAAQWRAMTAAQLDGLDLLRVPRRNYVMGRYARAWSPDHQTRVFHRARVTWPGHALHDVRRASAPSRVQTLRGWIEHKRYSRAGFADYFCGRRYDDRLLLVARQEHGSGKRAHWWDLAVRPCLAFWKFYLLKGGWRDGAFGLLIAQKAAVGTQLRYAALWAMQHDGRAAEAPRVPSEPGPEIH